jgi:hypothetical protein
MNQFVKDMLMAQSNRDGRNPYGSRGGYVSSSRPRRDREMYDREMHDREMYDMERYGMPKGDYRREYPDYNMRGDMRRSDYNSRDYGHNYDMRGRGGYNRDYGEYEDYGMYDYAKAEYGKLSHEDVENWKKHLKNEDGTNGEHFKKDQITQIARQVGVNPEEYGEHIFGLVLNMMYSDYCKVAKKFGFDRGDFYGELAKAFLNDKDFGGTPEEKVYLYYKCIAEQDD